MMWHGPDPRAPLSSDPTDEALGRFGDDAAEQSARTVRELLLSLREGVGSMKCPFGEDVGQPPSLLRCPRGFPGCACADAVILNEGPEADDGTRAVVAWWEAEQ